MWCLVLTSPCCCGPCETRITTGAKVAEKYFSQWKIVFLIFLQIIFISNIILWCCFLVLSILPLMSVSLEEESFVIYKQ